MLIVKQLFVNIFQILPYYDALPEINKNKGKNEQKRTEKGVQNCPTEKK